MQEMDAQLHRWMLIQNSIVDITTLLEEAETDLEKEAIQRILKEIAKLEDLYLV